MNEYRRVRLAEPDVIARVQRYLRERLASAVIRERVPLDVEAWTTSEPVPFRDAAAQQFLPLPIGSAWGKPWSTTWLRARGTAHVPSPGTRIELEIDLGFVADQVGFQCEALAYDETGRVIKAVNPRSRWVPLPTTSDFEILIEAAANPVILRPIDDDFSFLPTPLGDRETAGTQEAYQLTAFDIVTVDLEVEQLIIELELLVDLLPQLPPNSARRARLTVSLDDALDHLDPADAAIGAAAARARLALELARPAGESAHRLSAVGHAHIDSAWLWPFRETRRKVARTVANVLERMDADSDLVYAMSSAQQFAWIREDHPELFERLRSRVREGRFIPVGGMWVEADAVMPAGESFVRQLLLGQRWFEAEFGAICTVGWLPDSFGYSGALPQLLRGAGLTAFVTQKISWNRTNRFPHHLFEWEGIDGSRIVTHFPSADMYNSSMTPTEVLHAARNLQDKDLHNASILPFGYGDGGGGPTREMSARARLLGDLEGSPRVKIESPASYFTDLPDPAVLPVWFGELYLESHRGVSTSQARTKAAHRRLERLLQQAETWSTTATVRTGMLYPHEELRTLWQELLLMEFHDVLPGSSIAWVHQEAERRLDTAADRATALGTRALAALTDVGGSTVLINSSSSEWDGVPAHSIGVPTLSSGERTSVSRDVDALQLSNDRYSVSIDARGLITGLTDRTFKRELIQPGGAGNALLLHIDAPTRWDAWDLDPNVDGPGRLIDHVESFDVQETEDGAATVAIVRRHGASTFLQEMRLRPGSAHLELSVRVDWHEEERLLQLEFPLAIGATTWQAETQFGFLERPTVRNTSWDEARYEAAAHRWVRIADARYGVALINDRTYGHSARRLADRDGAPFVRLRASLLTASRFPDPRADQGEHVFRFALLGATDEAGTTRAAAQFAARPEFGQGQPVEALAMSTNPSVLLETLKLAEDRTGDIIARLYESGGGYAATSLILNFPHLHVRETDLIERPISEVTSLNNLSFRAFQIRTFRISPAPAEP